MIAKAHRAGRDRAPSVRTVRVEVPTDPNFNTQKARAKRAQKPIPHNMLTNQMSMSQQTQRQLTQIELARKNRSGQKRSLREYVDSMFDVLSDGQEHSVADISRAISGSWTSVHWCLELIETIQQRPRILRIGQMKRKRYYRMAAPKRR